MTGWGGVTSGLLSVDSLIASKIRARLLRLPGTGAEIPSPLSTDAVCPPIHDSCTNPARYFPGTTSRQAIAMPAVRDRGKDNTTQIPRPWPFHRAIGVAALPRAANL